MEVKWNLNGNWLLTASRDHLCKLFDIRNLKEELQVFRGHKKEATGTTGTGTGLVLVWFRPSQGLVLDSWGPDSQYLKSRTQMRGESLVLEFIYTLNLF